MAGFADFCRHHVLVYYLRWGLSAVLRSIWWRSVCRFIRLTRNACQNRYAEWLISLIVDGIIAGVGAVLNFVPQLIILFLLIAVLETTGYMSRIAFFLDRLFRRLGLSGKSLIPFIVGSGCSVPGVMATRTIEGDKERRMSIILTPFIPCSAKLPIMALFASYFFPDHSGLVSASLYFMAIIVIAFGDYYEILL